MLIDNQVIPLIIIRVYIVCKLHRLLAQVNMTNKYIQFTYNTYNVFNGL